jgi:hypothetical protein
MLSFPSFAYSRQKIGLASEVHHEGQVNILGREFDVDVGFAHVQPNSFLDRETCKG